MSLIQHEPKIAIEQQNQRLSAPVKALVEQLHRYFSSRHLGSITFVTAIEQNGRIKLFHPLLPNGNNFVEDALLKHLGDDHVSQDSIAGSSLISEMGIYTPQHLNTYEFQASPEQLAAICGHIAKKIAAGRKR
jgi:hypothetical protein